MKTVDLTFLAIRWEKNCHPSISGIKLEKKMTILDEGNNPILCIPNDNISIIGKARELMGKSKKVKGFFF